MKTLIVVIWVCRLYFFLNISTDQNRGPACVNIGVILQEVCNNKIQVFNGKSLNIMLTK